MWQLSTSKWAALFLAVPSASPSQTLPKCPLGACGHISLRFATWISPPSTAQRGFTSRTTPAGEVTARSRKPGESTCLVADANIMPHAKYSSGRVFLPAIGGFAAADSGKAVIPSASNGQFPLGVTGFS